jgi:5-methylcytosine-specific restriction endonuclease McrA
MPIDYKKYPSNWKTEIRPSILERDNYCCAFCGIANYGSRWSPNGKKMTLIVLTIAHLDHDITNNCPSNLKALCQKCHLSYDKDHHRKNARQTQKTKKGLLELAF